jgi:thiol reductant ABC exporter CydD subunit
MRSLDRRLLRASRVAQAQLAAAVVLGLVSAAAVIAQAVLLARVIAHVFLGHADFNDVRADLIALLAVGAVRAFVSWGFEASGHIAAARAMAALRARLVDRVFAGRPVALAGEPAGELAAAAVQGVDGLDAYFSRYLPQVVLAVLVPVAVLAWVIHVDLIAAAIMGVTLPLIPIFMVLIGRAAERATGSRWRALARLSGSFLDAVRGLPTLRAFNRAEAHAGALAEVGDRYRRETMKTLRIAFLSALVLELLAMLGTAMVAVVLGVRLVHGGVAFEDALTVLILAPELYLPMRQLGAQFHAASDGVAAAERIFELVDSPDESDLPRAAVAAPDVRQAAIRVERVSFAYSAREDLALDDLTLELGSGEWVALVGPNGAGKSTVAALLLRFADPASGAITVGGTDLRDIDVDAWRRQIAWVPQRPYLFSGSIADNIRLAEAGASRARVRAAAQLAGAAFVDGLPHGIDTRIGEGGRALSAGEARRIALARAFLRDAPLVILDEPTVHLDAGSAAEIGSAIERLVADRTALLIAHDASLAERADRVIALRSGRAVEPALRAAA